MFGSDGTTNAYCLESCDRECVRQCAVDCSVDFNFVPHVLPEETVVEDKIGRPSLLLVSPL